jgi:hypothetical protein
MPTYVFYDTINKVEFEQFMTMAEREKFLKKNKFIKQILTPSHIVSGVGRPSAKVDEGFKDILRNIKKKHPGSTVDV